MAMDTAIAKMVGQGKLPSCARLYGWTQPTLSIGRLQKTPVLNLPFLEENQIPVVRRPTGGRAVLHHDEITYSFALSKDFDWARKGTLNTYKILARVLLSALKKLGVENVSLEKSRTRENLQACYGAPSIYEISVNGRKLVGSAQYRGDTFVLQHGSIPFTIDIYTYSRCFKSYNLEESILEKRVITLSEILKERPSYECIVKAFKTSIEEVLEVHVDIIYETPQELRKLVEELKEDFRVFPVNWRDVSSGRPT